jgi:2-keto-4-pentenoate hydratase/2-oxohepta-3-ene-1,7-dioic acid hydratase in catechol pathway
MKLVRFGEVGAELPGIVDRRGLIRDVSNFVVDWAGGALGAVALKALSSLDLSTLPIVSPEVRLGPPVALPGKIICVGLNYADHAAETGFEIPKEPLVFFKSPTALCGPNDPIKIPKTAKTVDWEVELAFVIGREVTNVPEDEALAAVAGYAVANDLTEREWQFNRGGQWSKAKSADTFCPLGPWLVTTEEVSDLASRRIWLKKNEVVRQDTTLAQMVFSVPQIVAHLSEFMRLVPGDVVLTGTPFGVAFNKPKPDYLVPGDSIRCGIEGIGEQLSAVVS